jgi:hypothetical protein
MRSPIKVVRENYQMAKEALVETYEEDKVFYAFCAGSIFTSATSVVLIHVLESKGYIKKYNPDMPIPGLLMNKTDLVKNVGASVIAVEYLKERGLKEDFMEYAQNFVDTHKDVGIVESPQRLVVDLIQKG